LAKKAKAKTAPFAIVTSFATKFQLCECILTFWQNMLLCLFLASISSQA